MIESAAISILGSVAGIHSWFTGLRTGEISERMLEEMKAQRSSLERLTEHVLYIKSIREVKDITRSRQRILSVKQDLAELLTPLQRGIGEDIISTAVVTTPEKLRQALNNDPWDVLIDIRPVSLARKPENPNLAPIIFSHSGQVYIGWQAKGSLPSMFDFEYKPNSKLYLGGGFTRKPPTPPPPPDLGSRFWRRKRRSGCGTRIRILTLASSEISLQDPAAAKALAIASCHRPPPAASS